MLLGFQAAMDNQRVPSIGMAHAQDLVRTFMVFRLPAIRLAEILEFGQFRLVQCAAASHDVPLALRRDGLVSRTRHLGNAPVPHPEPRDAREVLDVR